MVQERRPVSWIKGFTLIELLVVIAILGILTGLVTINFNQARQRARDVARKNDLKQVQNALELYKNDKSPQTYPADAETDLVAGDYMGDFPLDPREKSLDGNWINYKYTWGGAGSPLTYTLIACLENEGDTDKDVVFNVYCSGVSQASFTLTEP